MSCHYGTQETQQRLRVLELARDNALGVRRLLATAPRYGDLHNQMARASMAVVFNLAEGRGMRSDRAKWLTALGENCELAEQARMLLMDEPQHPLHDRIDHVGRMLTKLTRALT